ncbi:cupin domain-containing protein [uncultured Algoriphagus sp.]|uniref:cupin domain-containing protein n=1 Tax=uncultured Algoriphagus sp. TaxID=417365 RepID=UPI0030EC4534|tara:strand:- start:607 stop:1116 length:510 start_codon:yes stop_codon:yes gene_type:complete
MKLDHTHILSLLITMTLGLSSCQQNSSLNGKEVLESLPTNEEQAIFPQGNLGSKENFTGNAYNYGLVPNDSNLTTLVGNVYFEPGARSNWHSHPAGQILVITDGEGFHQIEGQPKEILKKGSVAICPPNVRHWHGASPEKSLYQLYIVPNTEKGIVDWQEAVTDEVYLN